jgi:hypothetical protein
MAIGNCSSCSGGGALEALKQYQSETVSQRNNRETVQPDPNPSATSRAEGVNHPGAGEVVGSTINIAA